MPYVMPSSISIISLVAPGVVAFARESDHCCHTVPWRNDSLGQRVAPGVETKAWYEESGAVVHMTLYLQTQTVHRFAALHAWLAEDMTVYRGDNQDPAFVEKIRE